MSARKNDDSLSNMYDPDIKEEVIWIWKSVIG